MPKVTRKKVRGPVNGGAKGAAFERDIAKRLSLWLSYGGDENLFWRTAGSGGRSTQFAKRSGGKGIDNQASDISAQGEAGMHFTRDHIVECKTYKDIALWQLFFDAPNSIVGKWWAEAWHDARSVRKKPLLIIKGNLLKPLLVCVRDMNLNHIHLNQLDARIYKLDDFLEHITPHDFLDGLPGDPPCRIRPLSPLTSTSPTTRTTSTGGASSTTSKRPASGTASKRSSSSATSPTKRTGTQRS